MGANKLTVKGFKEWKGEDGVWRREEEERGMGNGVDGTQSEG